MKRICKKCCESRDRSEFRPGAAVCRSCDRKRATLKSAEAVAAGLCPQCCRNPASQEHKQCDQCNENAAKRRADRKSRGVCRCGNPDLPDPRRRLCAYCLQIDNSRIQSRKLSGMCIQCNKFDASEKSSYCDSCLFKKRARVYLKSSDGWVVIKAIWEKQGEICPYTGMKLILADAEVDHIIPFAKGGTSHPDNLHFIYHQANKMKWDYSEDEFLSLAAKVADTARSKGKIPPPDCDRAQYWG